MDRHDAYPAPHDIRILLWPIIMYDNIELQIPNQGIDAFLPFKIKL